MSMDRRTTLKWMFAAAATVPSLQSLAATPQPLATDVAGTQAGYGTDLGGYYLRTLVRDGFLKKIERGQYSITIAGKHELAVTNNGSHVFVVRPRLAVLRVAHQGALLGQAIGSRQLRRRGQERRPLRHRRHREAHARTHQIFQFSAAH